MTDPAPLVLLTATWTASTDLAADEPLERVAEFVDAARRRLDGPGFAAFTDAVDRSCRDRDVELRAVQPGLGFWPGGAEPSARFALLGPPAAMREVAVEVARTHDQEAVRLVWPAPLPGAPVADLAYTDLTVRYSTAGRPTAEVLRRLVGGTDTPGGSLLDGELHVDAGGGFLASAHAELAEWLAYGGWSWCAVERWGRDGQLGLDADHSVPGGWVRPATVPALRPDR